MEAARAEGAGSRSSRSVGSRPTIGSTGPCPKRYLKGPFLRSQRPCDRRAVCIATDTPAVLLWEKGQMCERPSDFWGTIAQSRGKARKIKRIRRSSERNDNTVRA
jgi:hypothetical protein